MQGLADELSGNGRKVTPLLVQGPTVHKIMEQVDQLNPDLVILGSHGHGALYHLLVGSVAEGVMHKIRCPLLVIPARK